MIGRRVAAVAATVLAVAGLGVVAADSADAHRWPPHRRPVHTATAAPTGTTPATSTSVPTSSSPSLSPTTSSTRATAPAGPVVAPSIARIEICDGAVGVAYGALTLPAGGTVWEAWRSDGREVLWAHEVSARSGSGGTWVAVEDAADGGSRTGLLRWAGYQQTLDDGAHWDLIRVEAGGYVSTSRPIEGTCP